MLPFSRSQIEVSHTAFCSFLLAYHSSRLSSNSVQKFQVLLKIFESRSKIKVDLIMPSSPLFHVYTDDICNYWPLFFAIYKIINIRITREKKQPTFGLVPSWSISCFLVNPQKYKKLYQNILQNFVNWKKYLDKSSKLNAEI